uniref:Uncharacterized protein n=1 Tax=Manihot esculenta TaxID=3983 RepID=A0A2C9VWU8_MANES
MGYTSTLSPYFQPKISLSQQSDAFGRPHGVLVSFSNTALSFTSRRTCFRYRTLVVRAVDGGSRRQSNARRVYRQSQGESAFRSAPVQQIASFVVPAGAFMAFTFVLWKLVEKIVMPKPKRPTLVENKSSAPAKGMNWSFAAGTNLFPGLTAKIDRESKQKLNEFAKEIRSFSIVDMSGCNFGDDGLFFLAESLAYNQLLSDSRGSEFCCKWNNCRRNKSL